MASLLTYCKLTELADDPEVQALIPGMYAAAVGYLEDAGVSPAEEGTPRAARYDLAVNCLVLDAWDHRDMTVPTAQTDNLAFQRLINQLKLTEGVAPIG